MTSLLPIAKRFGSYLTLIERLRWAVTAQLLCDREFFISFRYPTTDEEYTLHHVDRDAELMTVCSALLDVPVAPHERRATNEILARINDHPLASVSYLRAAEPPRLVGRAQTLCLRPEDAEAALLRCCRSLASVSRAYRFEQARARADAWLFFAAPDA